MKRTKDSLRDLWDNVKHTNIRIIGVLKKKRKRKGMRTFLKRLYLKIVVCINNGILLSHKRIKLESVELRWTNLETVIKSEVNQKEKDIVY